MCQNICKEKHDSKINASGINAIADSREYREQAFYDMSETDICSRGEKHRKKNNYNARETWHYKRDI